MSERVTEINQEIEGLQQQFKNVKGTETEVYTRIVGYYRSVGRKDNPNWNPGKFAEFKERKGFDIVKSLKGRNETD
jgi:ribonucleoside-triphosphate reductase